MSKQGWTKEDTCIVVVMEADGGILKDLKAKKKKKKGDEAADQLPDGRDEEMRKQLQKKVNVYGPVGGTK